MWSPDLKRAVSILHYWQTTLHAKLRGKQIHPDVKIKLDKEVTKWDKHQGHPEWSPRKQYKRALQKLRKVTANDQEIRRKFLTELIKATSDSEARPIKAILHTEYIIKLHQNFNMSYKKPKKRIWAIKKLTEEGHIEFHLKQEIDKQIYHHNINHFMKPRTSRSPFATNPLLGHLGHGATTPEANDFVWNPDHELPRDIPNLARKILDKLRPHHNEPPPANSEITPKDLIAAFTAWKEKTSTSPAGTHLGHYKVWLRNYMSNDEAKEEGKGEGNPHMTAEEYFNIQAKKLNLAISLAHPLKRWKKVHMLLLPKDDNAIPNINRMRPIDSFDAEINLIRQILVSHRTIHQAEQRGVITNNQWVC